MAKPGIDNSNADKSNSSTTSGIDQFKFESALLDAIKIINPRDKRIFKDDSFDINIETGEIKSKVRTSILANLETKYLSELSNYFPNGLIINYKLDLIKADNSTLNIKNGTFTEKNIDNKITNINLDVIDNGKYSLLLTLMPVNFLYFTKDIVKKTSFYIDKIYKNSGNVIAYAAEGKSFVLESPNFQTFLTKNSKSKVLFNFYRPTAYYEKSILETIKDAKKDDLGFNIAKLEMGKEFDKFLINYNQPRKIKIYKTDLKPSSKDEIINDANLYKILDITKKELSFQDILETDKDYYFLAESSEFGYFDEIKPLALASLYIGFLLTTFDKNKAEQLAKEAIQPTSDVFQIKVIKDEKLYFLEENVLDFSEEVERKPTFTFMNKIFVEPIFQMKNGNIKTILSSLEKPFVSSDDSFDSSQDYPYLKLRITSKKSKRKFDLNLNYGFNQVISTITQQKLNTLSNKKLKVLYDFTLIQSFKPSGKIDDPNNIKLILLKSLILEFLQFVQAYISDNNRQTKIIINDNSNEYKILDAEKGDMLKILDLAKKESEEKYNKFSTALSYFQTEAKYFQ